MRDDFRNKLQNIIAGQIIASTDPMEMMSKEDEVDLRGKIDPELKLLSQNLTSLKALTMVN